MGKDEDTKTFYEQPQAVINQHCKNYYLTLPDNLNARVGSVSILDIIVHVRKT